MKTIWDVEISPEDEAILKAHYPLVQFIIPSALKGVHYQDILIKLLQDFLLSLSPLNEGDARVLENFRGWNGAEGGIALYIGELHIPHCKLFCFDGSDKSAYIYSGGMPWHGLFFRDHDDHGRVGHFNTAKVFEIAKAFEAFLKATAVEYTRINHPRQVAS